MGAMKKADAEAEEKRKADADLHKKLDAIADSMGGLCKRKRMDAIEEDDKERKDNDLLDCFTYGVAITLGNEEGF